jgi:hypothetical protein
MRALLTLLLKVVALILGTAALLDAALPTADQAMRVDGHHASHDRRPTRTNYTIELVGGTTDSCGVGYQAYETLHDGDPVTVTTSRLFKQCASIARDGVEVHAHHTWRLWSLLIGAALIGVGLGKLPLGNNSDDD